MCYTQGEKARLHVLQKIFGVQAEYSGVQRSMSGVQWSTSGVQWSTSRVRTPGVSLFPPWLYFLFIIVYNQGLRDSRH
jgi:hypothetical protein